MICEVRLYMVEAPCAPVVVKFAPVILIGFPSAPMTITVNVALSPSLMSTTVGVTCVVVWYLTLTVFTTDLPFSV